MVQFDWLDTFSIYLYFCPPKFIVPQFWLQLTYNSRSMWVHNSTVHKSLNEQVVEIIVILFFFFFWSQMYFSDFFKVKLILLHSILRLYLMMQCSNLQAFCSSECRDKQILIDKSGETRSNCKVARRLL